MILVEDSKKKNEVIITGSITTSSDSNGNSSKEVNKYISYKGFDFEIKDGKDKKGNKCTIITKKVTVSKSKYNDKNVNHIQGLSIYIDNLYCYNKDEKIIKKSFKTHIEKFIKKFFIDTYKDRPKEVRDIMKFIRDNNDFDYNSLYEFYYYQNLYEKDEGIEISRFRDFCLYMDRYHNFYKFGPEFICKYIDCTFDTRGHDVFAIRLRDIGFNDKILNKIPKAWISKETPIKIYLRDKMDDGFRNLGERLVVLKYLIKGNVIE